MSHILHKPNFLVIFLLAALKAADRFVSCFGSSRQICRRSGTKKLFPNSKQRKLLEAADKKMTKKLGYN
jgi:hypothetical protein